MMRQIADRLDVRPGEEVDLRFKLPPLPEAQERTVFLRDRRVSCPFVECLEFADDFCRIPGDVENFLYQSGQGERKLT